MPNPLAKVKPNAGVILGNVGTPSPLNHNPALALAALDVIRSWSDVENFRLGFYMEILGRRNENAKIAFLALESSAAQIASINAVAGRALSGKTLDAYYAVTKLSKRFSKIRNEICHWTWGYSPELPDAFLLVDPKADSPEGDLRRDLIFVYTASDFTNAIMQNQRLAGYYHLFRFIVMGHVANRNGELEKELQETAEISVLMKK